MELNVSWDAMRRKKLMIATPMYGGQCFGTYTQSMAVLSKLLVQQGIELNFFFLYNESLIQRARNYCADAFMRSDNTHLLFIDADIGFNPEDVITMLAISDEEDENNPYDILCATYPKKTISWEKIKLAVDKGFADENPEALQEFIGDFVFNPVEGNAEHSLNEPIEVAESGTGFMMIKRKVFENFEKHYPEKSYKPDHVRTADFDGSREIFAYFDCPIDPISKRYLSEDYAFCQMVRAIGNKVYIAPWIRLSHTGSMVFGGSLGAMAALGTSPTADAGLLKKNKKNKK